MTACANRGCDVESDDPVVVSQIFDLDWFPTGRFCNYGCFAAHTDRSGLATGLTCRVDP